MVAPCEPPTVGSNGSRMAPASVTLMDSPLFTKAVVMHACPQKSTAISTDVLVVKSSSMVNGTEVPTVKRS